MGGTENVDGGVAIRVSAVAATRKRLNMTEQQDVEGSPLQIPVFPCNVYFQCASVILVHLAREGQ